MRDSILLERDYAWPIEAVWQALTQSELLAQWLMPNSFVLEVGRTFHFQALAQPFFDGKVNCELIAFREPIYLEYTWKGGPMPVATRVIWRLEAVDDTHTRLSLEHSGFSGWFTQLVVRRILENGWKGLLAKELPQLLQKRYAA